MPVTTVSFSDNLTATVFKMQGAGTIYNFGDAGRIHVQPGYFGQPDRPAVTISLGRAGGDASGYKLSGLLVGDLLLTGSVWCSGDALAPGPHPTGPGSFALDGIDGAARSDAADLLATIAQHYHHSINF